MFMQVRGKPVFHQCGFIRKLVVALLKITFDNDISNTIKYTVSIVNQHVTH